MTSYGVERVYGEVDCTARKGILRENGDFVRIFGSTEESALHGYVGY